MPTRHTSAVLRFILALLAAISLCHTAHADGKGFVRALQNVPTPDQRIAIVFDGTHQTLIVDTTLATAEKDAAWIVPLPSEPTIEAVSEGFFPVLEIAFGPRVVSRWTAWLAVIPGIIVVLLLTARIRIPWLRALVAAPTVLLALTMCLLPSLGRASSQPIPLPGVTVLARERVGVFDTAVIRGETGEAATKWLDANGFHTPSAARPALDAYAKDGWCFAVARVHATDGNTAEPGTLRPHPLAFRFKTGRAVYPLRLTGVQSEPCRVKLWVFAQEQASVEGLRQKLAAQVPAPNDPYQESTTPTRRPSHSAVNTLIARQPVVTVLEGELSPKQMSRDAWLSWEPLGGGKGWEVYERHTALIRAIDVGLVVLLIGLAFLIAPAKKLRASCTRIGTALAISSIGVALWLHFGVERVDVRKVSVRHGWEHTLSKALSEAVKTAGHNADCPTLLARAQAAIDASIEEDWPARYGQPPEGRLSIGDGPNQYQLFCSDGKLTARYVNPLGWEEDVQPD